MKNSIKSASYSGGGIACINAGVKDNSFRCLMTRLSETGGRVFLCLKGKGEMR